MTKNVLGAQIKNKNMENSNVNAQSVLVNGFLLNAMLMTDGYKLGHKTMYPQGMTKLYSNFTPRSNKYFPEADKGVVVFGIQYFIVKDLVDVFNSCFFNLPLETVINQYYSFISGYLGEDCATMIGTDHIKELHQLGYLPLHIKALPEGTYCPIGTPVLTVTNTHDDFAWLVNYLESITSNELWLPMTSATRADVFKRELIRHAIKTGFFNPEDSSNLDFLCHDFSMRGMAGLDATISSGMAHLTSFLGSESLPAVVAANYYYASDIKNNSIELKYEAGRFRLTAGTIPATEHSIECTNANDGTGVPDDERYFAYILSVFKTGFISVVADGYDYWYFVSVIIPKYKDEIMARNGRVVVRPDSGDPVKIVCGDSDAEDPVVRMGTYELLSTIFPCTINKAGYKVLDSHIGVIYGDSINVKRQKDIYRQLENKCFAGTNLVLGIGSFTYNMVSRDSLGFAMKATYCMVNGKGISIYKDPKTAVGMPKKSHKGLLCVKEINGEIVTLNDVTPEVEASDENMLKTVFYNGTITPVTFADIRKVRYESAYKAVMSENK